MRHLRPAALAATLALVFAGLGACSSDSGNDGGAPRPQSASRFAMQPALEMNTNDVVHVPKGYSDLNRWNSLKATLEEQPDPDLHQTSDSMLYLDASLTHPITTVNQFNYGSVVIGPSFTGQSATRYRPNTLAKRGGDPLVLFPEDTWGVFPTYYLVQRSDKSGDLLEHPEVTPIVIEDMERYPAPVLNNSEGSAIVTFEDLGDDVEEVRLVKSILEVSRERTSTEFLEFPLTPSEIDAGRIDLTDPRVSLDGYRRANEFVRTKRLDITDFQDESMIGQADAYFSRDSAKLFLVVKKGGQWTASDLLDYTDLGSRIPVAPYEGELETVSGYVTARSVPEYQEMITADGRVRRFAYDVEVVKDYDTVVDIRRTLRNTSFSLPTMTVAVGDGYGTIEELQERTAAYAPPIDLAPAESEVLNDYDGWIETRPDSGVPETGFGTSELSRYIADSLQAGYNQMPIGDFPEAGTSQQVSQVLSEVVGQNPLTLYPGGNGHPAYDLDLETGMLTIKTDTASREEFLDKRNEIRALAQAVIKERITPDMSDREKVAALNAWLVENVTYDDYLAATPYRFSTEDGQTALGALRDKRAICTGYAHALIVMAREAGLEAVALSGTTSGAGHMWTKVKVDGEWLNVDPTFNATSGVEDYVSFLTDDELQEKSPRYFGWVSSFQPYSFDAFQN
ncbi:MAG: transglutaminase-like domain-containing protein [Bowdeniella nasicola]|nr:transglutaminase-like domain-containing protein [Bowdeniella nasicola]